MSLTYLASPYADDPFIRERRYIDALQAVASMLRNGRHVYSPIIHCHELAKVANLPRDTKFWRDYNFAVLRRCHEVVVLMLSDWDTDEDINAAVFEAKRNSIPVHYLPCRNLT